MSSNLVIVAIPDQNDQVWKVSSEKIPHLTLLFLGDSGQVSNLDQIMLFVEHAASTSLKRFYLPVDYRGELGADKADVLFFKKGRYDFAAVRDFRSLLLKDTNIKTAYDSAKQFEEPKDTGQAGQPWIPHLTLGYPTAPAKSLPDGENFYDVSFNRIAVWTGDFEGPEFLLKDYWEDPNEMDIPMDVAMSDLQHHGVKGQKREAAKSVELVEPVENSMAQTTEMGAEFLAHLSEEPWSNFTKADYTLEQWHAACLIHTHDGDPTAKSECKLPVKTPDGALNRNGVHAAAAALAGARGGLKGVSDDQKKKAAGALRRYYTQLNEDPPESLTQSAVDLGSEFVLEHFGVKGMHWGQRKSPPMAVSTSSTSVVPHGTRRKTKIQVAGGENHPAHADAVKVAEARIKLKRSGTAALSNQELRDMANRLQLENQVAILTSSKGKQFVSREFEIASKQLIKRGTKQGVKTYGPTVAKKAGKAAATAATIAVL
jgi:2'-5' RNA ligase